MVTLESMPLRLTAGDEVQWLADSDSYSVNDYTFSYSFMRKDGQASFEVVQNGQVNGAPRFHVDQESSAKFKPGQYFWQLYAFDADKKRTTVVKGYISILKNYAVTNEISQNRRIFNALSDLLEGKASDDTSSVTINGKSITSLPISELLKFHTYYDGLVKQEENEERIGAGLKSGRTIRVRFNSQG